MTQDSAVEEFGLAGTGPRYALVPVHGYDIVAATVLFMIDDGQGGTAVASGMGYEIPFGAQPVLVAPSTVYAMAGVAHALRTWPAQTPRPWLVLVADVPAAPAPAARFRIRSLRGRLAGVVHVPYLPVLRAAEGPEEAMKDKSVRRAAENLRRELRGK